MSSTKIRHLLDGGDVERAATALGRPYELRGIVVRGVGRGRGLGFPTANLGIAKDKLVPAFGVYAARAFVPGGTTGMAAAVNIGVAPTFEGPATPTVEAHLLDFAADLYGQTLRVQLLRRLRDERRFAGAAELVEQIRADVDAVRGIVSAQPEA